MKFAPVIPSALFFATMQPAAGSGSARIQAAYEIGEAPVEPPATDQGSDRLMKFESTASALHRCRFCWFSVRPLALPQRGRLRR